MAYSCVRVLFELGHEATVRNKKTPQGYTHDWELFVRGSDNTDIHHFVDKVIFYLHESFQSPKRVVKEPPFIVRESGYAGFALPIEIHFKNHEEPYKVRYKYHLTLQDVGPTTNVVKEKYVFSNPSEDFRRKLIRGGGVGVVAEGGAQSSFNTKSKGLDTLKKPPKIKESVPPKDDSSNTDSFSIFGLPIKTAKFPIVSKNKTSSIEKSLPTASKSKYGSSYKEKEGKTFSSDKGKMSKEIESSKKESKGKESEKKGSNKSAATAVVKNESSNNNKQKLPEEMGKMKEKCVTSTDKKKESNSNNKKDKLEKEKYENINSNNDSSKNSNNNNKKEALVKNKEKRKDKQKEDGSGGKKAVADLEEDKVRKEDDKAKVYKNLFVDSPAEDESSGGDKGSDKSNKHKKKNKKDKKEKRDKDKQVNKREDKKGGAGDKSGKSCGVSPRTKLTRPLSALFEELSEGSSDDDRLLERVEIPATTAAAAKELPPTPPKRERESSAEGRSKKKSKKRKEEKSRNLSSKMHLYESQQQPPPQQPTAATAENGGGNNNERVEKFTPDYIIKLKKLQWKIMHCNDTTGLQEVVSAVSSTGQYELTPNGFDFNLCSLDANIVARLYDYFKQHKES